MCRISVNRKLFSRKIMKNYLVAIISAIIFTVSGTALAAPMTKDQGDAILKELREIKQLLARQQPPAPPAQRMPQTMTVKGDAIYAVSYTHLRAHETDSYLVCRLLLEKK